MNNFVLKRSLGIMAGVLAASIAGGSIVYAQRPKEISVDWDDRPVELYTSAGTVREALAEAGLTALDEVQISEDPSEPIREGMHLELDTKKQVKLQVGGVQRTVATYVNTIGALLEEQGVVYDADDEISPARAEALKDGTEVRVDSIQVITSTETKAVPYETIVEETADLYTDQEEIVQEGQDGICEVTKEMIVRNGVIETRRIASEKVVQEPITEQIRKGTAERPSARYAGPSGAPSGGTTLVMEATAYTHTGNPTATGAWPTAYYTVAVDPSVIPMGTRLYVEGYGYAVAQDTGGAIIGNRIDVFFDSEGECINWGRRSVVVHVLD
uniref:3D domain-containing protein n=1 Tax=Ndongobacter massiliensis TaxID=1871025 RepID=UPI000A5FF75B|nr:3D domain-containing protein [Ndongobacter massiliensis]